MINIGDRVRVYDSAISFIGVVKGTDAGGLFLIGVEYRPVVSGDWYHPKQCRKLKPKKTDCQRIKLSKEQVYSALISSIKVEYRMGPIGVNAKINYDSIDVMLKELGFE